MGSTIAYYSGLIESFAPGLQLFFGLILAGKVMIYGSRLVYRALLRR